MVEKGKKYVLLIIALIITIPLFVFFGIILYFSVFLISKSIEEHRIYDECPPSATGIRFQRVERPQRDDAIWPILMMSSPDTGYVIVRDRVYYTTDSGRHMEKTYVFPDSVKITCEVPAFVRSGSKVYTPCSIKEFPKATTKLLCFDLFTNEISFSSPIKDDISPLRVFMARDSLYFVFQETSDDWRNASSRQKFGVVTTADFSTMRRFDIDDQIIGISKSYIATVNENGLTVHGANNYFFDGCFALYFVEVSDGFVFAAENTFHPNSLYNFREDCEYAIYHYNTATNQLTQSLRKRGELFYRLHHSSGDMILISTLSDGFYFSSDGGHTWETEVINNASHHIAYCLLPSYNTIAYLGRRGKK